jgi:hypothetical protein
MISTRVTSPFGFESTAAEVIASLDLHDRRALVTGAASGIGVETARALASAAAGTDATGVAATPSTPKPRNGSGPCPRR